MKSHSSHDIAAGLKEGRYDDPPPHLLAQAVQLIADELAPAGAGVGKEGIRRAMDVLRCHRHFHHMHLLGAAWRDTQGCDPVIQRLLAQATVELGAFDKADELLDEAEAASGASNDLEFQAQSPDCHALRGRIRKQKFVLCGDVNLLQEAAACYQKLYASRPSFFPGVNILAVRTRLQGYGLDQAGEPLATLARSVMKQAIEATRSNPGDPWALAAASEACLALDQLEPEVEWCDKAELWLHRFLGHKGTGPFEVESYFRQVRELWQGDSLYTAHCAGRLAAVLERHVMNTQRKWSADAKQMQRVSRASTDELEKNFSGEKSFTVADVRKMLDLSPNVGCITDVSGVRMGTGFLMPGVVFGKPFELVFITNAHVIGKAALPWQQARVTFEIESVGAGNPVPHEVQEVLFTSEPGKLGHVPDAPGKLDVTVCVLRSLPKGLSGLPIAGNIPLPSPRTKAFVVGHPLAGPLQFSLQDSVLLDVCPKERLVHYRTPTDPGSSGSPVFNDRWEVLALHHAGSQACPRLNGQGEYQANEGITLQAIQRAMGVGA
jgi:hypothetical protein